MINKIFEKINNETKLDPEDLLALLNLDDIDDIISLYDKAYKVKLKYVGNKSFYRGIIEFSNICIKDCYYCGIRKGNKNVERYLMKEEEILKGAEWAYKNDYGSIVLQSGERDDDTFIDFIEDLLRKIKHLSDGKLGITISLGEQTEETYRRWFNAGAHRYLLRIETSNSELYNKIHPKDHDFIKRKNCLSLLKKVGYQVGSGVMIGLPYQTTEDLVNDILFFEKSDLDMIGMGPYIVSEDTPLSKQVDDYDSIKFQQLSLSLKMIAVTRIYLKDVNIAATTALQSLVHNGRERGLKAGANIIMPNVTDTDYRTSYQLYDNKPCLDENSGLCRSCLEKRIYGIDEEIGYGEWGDSPHYKNRIANDKMIK